MARTKLMFISDAPTSATGLGRITRELAVRTAIDLSEYFDVATLGCGGTYSKNLPFPNYPGHLDNFVMPELPFAWKDFAGSLDAPGIIMTVWNAAWLWWIADPKRLPEGSDVRHLLESGNIKKWAYFPTDAYGPNGKMVDSVIGTLSKIDRILAYTRWAAYDTDKSFDRYNPTSDPVTEYLPHGTDTSVFYPRDKKEARKTLVPRLLNQPSEIHEKVLMLSIVATNTIRKDWGLGFEVCAELLNRGIEVGLWAHTDTLQRPACWDLPMLCQEFGMKDRTIFTNSHYSDEQMAWAYSACDVHLGIGSGEGWGLPLSENLACGVPVIHGDYAGGTEIVPDDLRVKPCGFRLEGYYACQRPVFNASDWADKVIYAKKTYDGGKSLLNPKYAWDGEDGAWKAWRKWLIAGVESK